MEITESCVRTTILVMLWLDYLWETYLSVRQYRKVKATEVTPEELKNVLVKEDFDKARLYSLAKLQFSFVSDFFNIVISTIVLQYGVLAYLWNVADSFNQWEGEVGVSCIWIFILTTLSTIVHLPLGIYFTFVLEEQFGFNKQTAKFFAIDKLKGYVVTQVLVQPIAAVCIVIIKYGGDYFFVWLWGVVGFIVMFLQSVYPSYIAPLFDKYTPLPEGELRTKIESLATQLKFPLSEIYIVEGSKRSAHSNAYFTGLFRYKRIVLYDNLLENPLKGGCTNDEVVAILGHELGHWSHGHIIKNLIIVQLNLFFMFSIFSITFRYDMLYRALYFVNTKPVLVGLLIVMQYVMLVYNNVVTYLVTCLSRRFENQADEFAIKLGKAELLKSALVKLNKDNLGFPVYDKLYSSYHYSHPPLLERLATIDSKKSR